MNAESAKVIFEESKKAYDSASETLSGYRDNVTKVLALVTASAAFFAFEDSAKGWLFFAALVSYVGVVAVAGLLYRPLPWASNIAKDGVAGLQQYGERLPPAKVYLDLARAYQRAYGENLNQINGRWGVSQKYQALLGLVGLTVVLMLLNSAQQPNPTPDEPLVVVIKQE